MTVYAITDTKKGEQGLRLLIFKLPTSRVDTTKIPDETNGRDQRTDIAISMTPSNENHHMPHERI